MTGHRSTATRIGLRPVALGRRGMVATANPLATQAGIQMLAAGGNAVDAIVAAAAALGVVEPCMSGVGGCGVLMLSAPGLGPRALNFFGRAPTGATPDRLGTTAARTGPASVAVPGNLAGWARALRDHGTVALHEALAPAIDLAEQGTPLTVFDRQMFGEHGGNLDDEGRRIFLGANRMPAVGTLIIQRDLAATLRTIGREGTAAFYDGPIADAIIGHLDERGGLLTQEDLRAYPDGVEWTPAIESRYHDVQVFGPPPPSSGVQILETLNGLEAYRLGDLAHLGPTHLELVAGVSRLARLDTDQHVGDPTFVTVPVEDLLSPAHAASLRARLRHPVEVGPGVPPEPLARGASTTHLAACDASGLAVNITQSHGRGFGSGVVVRGTGLVLNNALLWASGRPSHPNVVAPGKRHEWPLSPLQLFREGRFWATVGSPGSYGILVTSVQVITNLVDFDLNVQDAVSAARFRWADEMTDALPASTVLVESRIPARSRARLAELGHRVEVLGPWSMRVGGAQAIVRDPETGWFLGGADPRRNGYAIGWS